MEELLEEKKFEMRAYDKAELALHSIVRAVRKKRHLKQ